MAHLCHFHLDTDTLLPSQFSHFNKTSSHFGEAHMARNWGRPLANVSQRTESYQQPHELESGPFPSRGFRWDPHPWPTLGLQLHERPWSRGPSKTIPGFKTHRNYEIMYVCCFKAQSLLRSNWYLIYLPIVNQLPTPHFGMWYLYLDSLVEIAIYTCCNPQWGLA